MTTPSCIASAIALCACFSAAASAQVTFGQIDTFQSGTTQGWQAGANHPAPPANVASGGPGGAGDAFLRLTAIGGSGSGNALAAFNRAQWAGDYTAAGITQIVLNVSNFGPQDVFLRLLFWDRPLSGNPTNGAITDAVVVPAGSGWQQASFLVALPNLTPILGTAGAALTNCTELRLFHNPDPTYPFPPVGPPPISTMLGVDNIQAVPAPSSLVIAGLGLAALAHRRRRGHPA